jgi:hypothetical protein
LKLIAVSDVFCRIFFCVFFDVECLHTFFVNDHYFPGLLFIAFYKISDVR